MLTTEHNAAVPAPGSAIRVRRATKWLTPLAIWPVLAVSLLGVEATQATELIEGGSGDDVIHVWKVSNGYRARVCLEGEPCQTTPYNAPQMTFTVKGFAGNDKISGRQPGGPGGQGSPLDMPLIAYGGPGNDTIYGGDCEYCGDILYGNDGDDTIKGFKGDDDIFGGKGNDKIDGGRGDDTIEGGKGNDEIRGKQGNDVIIGDEGDDKIWGGYGRDKIEGAAGNDVIKTEHGPVNMANGGSGNDKITGCSRLDHLYGGPGKDMIKGSNGDDDIEGGAGNDKIYGQRGNDKIKGGSGADYIKGGDGKDTILGEEHCDIVNGGSKVDTINGNEGEDKLFGGGKEDTVNGDGDDDLVVGGGSVDTVNGGAGNDVCHECPAPDNCSACETLSDKKLRAVGAQDPVHASYDPVTQILDLEGDFIDWFTDSENLSQHIDDNLPCHDPALDLIVSDTTLTGQSEETFFFSDIDIELRDEQSTTVLAAVVTDVTLDAATGRFNGTVDVMTVDINFGSIILNLMQQAMDEGETIIVEIMCSDSGKELKEVTNGFTEAGEATGPFAFIFEQDPSVSPDPEDCTNEIDDNGDGCIDCDDQLCAQDPACRELVCNDSIDNDGDGLTDCEDEDCADGPPCTEDDCGDSIDNDGSMDCFDPDCLFDELCVEDCTNGVDDNGTDLIDCADPVCKDTDDICIEMVNCADGIDNDLDELTDCEDPECVFDDACAPPEACCLGGGTCDLLLPGDCDAAGGEPQGFGAECLGDANENGTDDACEGACCDAFGPGVCTVGTQAFCDDLFGNYVGNGTVCLGDDNENGVDDVCEGACCLDAPPVCLIMTPTDCEASTGEYQGSGSQCLGDNNGNGYDDACDPAGACCLPEADCILVTVTECEELIGIYYGDNSSCQEVECIARGACCLSDHSCTTVTEPECAAEAGEYLGDGEYCMGDSNGDGYDDACVAPAIPAVSEWGMVAMTLLTLTAGTLIYVRRRASHA